VNKNTPPIPAEVCRYLADHHVLTLATQGPSGLWAAAVFYVSQGDALYFLSAGHTRHARNIAANPQVAGTIQEDYADWQAIQGIQLAGEVSLLTGAAREEAITRYKQKYPFIARPAAGEMATKLQKALAVVNWYRLQVTKLYFIDNRQGFGHRDEIW
jgi:uncharacterized protein YhbP (UPF0306 family)